MEEVSRTTVTHQGKDYTIGDGIDGDPVVEYMLSTSYRPKLACAYNHDVGWHYELTCAHEGPVIKIVVKNPRMEPGSYGGYYVDYDGVYWGDDGEKFSDDLWDVYSDAVRDDMRELLTMR